MIRQLLAFALIAILQGTGSAVAQDYPTRPVRFIVPFGPGAGADIAARLFADRLATRWGKPVLVENRPGGDGLVAIGAFTSTNDDHVLLWAPAGTFAVHPYEHDKLPYDAERDLLPIASVSSIILAASAAPSLNVTTFAQLVELARAQPGKLNAAAANGNSDFLLFGFLKSAKLEVAKIPYRDILQAPNDLSEGRIQLLMASLAVVQPHMQAGKIKVLAVTSRSRAPSAPTVPTFAEAGFPALELDSPAGLFGPRGMPAPLRQRIADDLREVLAANPVIASRIEATGQTVGFRGPAELTADIAELRAKLADTAKILGFKSAQ
jgi:tripartite-type tricarboxylate transporter receptor subunit TctC